MITSRMMTLKYFSVFVAFGVMQSVDMIGSAEVRTYSGDTTQYRSLPLFSPCTFPVPSPDDELQTRENYRVCNVRRSLSFVCDLHFQLTQQNVNPLVRAYDWYRAAFEGDGWPLLEIVLVKQLAAPSSRHVNLIDAMDVEFGCLYRTPGLFVSREIIEKLAHSSKTFTKVYAAALFRRWFPRDEACVKPKILALVVLDGLLADPRKLTSVNIYTDNPEFALLVANIQLEAANALLQGVPLVAALTDLVELLGHALRDFNSTISTPGQWRKHGGIPIWAWELVIVSVVLVVVALVIEWYLVRRSVAVKRTAPGQQVDAVRSKTHLLGFR